MYQKSCRYEGALRLVQCLLNLKCDHAMKFNSNGQAWMVGSLICVIRIAYFPYCVVRNAYFPFCVVRNAYFPTSKFHSSSPLLACLFNVKISTFGENTFMRAILTWKWLFILLFTCVYRISMKGRSVCWSIGPQIRRSVRCVSLDAEM